MSGGNFTTKISQLIIQHKDGHNPEKFPLGPNPVKDRESIAVQRRAIITQKPRILQTFERFSNDQVFDEK